jgi:hypothetical protein
MGDIRKEVSTSYCNLVCDSADVGFLQDPICPTERENKRKWTEETKILKNRSRSFWEGGISMKGKTLFDD